MDASSVNSAARGRRRAIERKRLHRSMPAGLAGVRRKALSDIPVANRTVAGL